MKRKLQFPIDIEAREVPAGFTLEATTDFQAAKDTTEKPKITMLANTGKPMKLKGYPEKVIVDIQGVRFDKARTPIIQDHDTTKRLGHTTKQYIDKKNGIISAEGILSSSSQYAKDIVLDAKDGFPFQTSIGATIVNGYFLEAGEIATINGKDYQGPLIVASETLIRELTVTVLGADKDTSAVITATIHLERNRRMDFEAYLASLDLVAADLAEGTLTKLKAEHARIQKLEASNDNGDPEPPKKKRKALKKPAPIMAGADDDDSDDYESRIQARRDLEILEDERRDAIREIAAKFEDKDLGEIKVGKKTHTLKSLKAEAFRDSEFSADAFELVLLKASRAEMPDAPAPQMVNKDIQNEVMQASLCRYIGIPENAKNANSEKQFGLTSMFDEKTLTASHLPQYNFGGSIQALLDMQIRAAGMIPQADRRSKSFLGQAVQAWNKIQDSTIQANGFSALNITNILENTMHKVALSSFQSAEGVGLSLCARRPLNDFKTHNMYRLDPKGSVRKVGIDGELKHVSMTDTKMTLSADTYGAMISIDYKTIRNDDLGLVIQQCRDIGLMVSQRLEESIFVTLLANTGSFFSVGNGNYLTSGSSALGLTSLETARRSFMNMVLNGKPIGVQPRILLVGTTLATLAGQLYNETKLEVTTTADLLTFANNPNAGLYRPVVSPYLNNTNITDQDGNALSNQSSTKWYLMADPNAAQGSVLVAGFLDGRETPYFDEAETNFNVPRGMQFRCYMDWGVALNTYQMGLMSDGA